MTEKPQPPSQEEVEAEVARAMADECMRVNPQMSANRADLEAVMLHLFQVAMKKLPEIMKRYGPPPGMKPPKNKPQMHRH
jgi:hypothetical protein